MALAFDLTGKKDAIGSMFIRLVKITLDNSYVGPGGWAITPAQCGFGSGGQIIDMAIINPIVAGKLVEWDQANLKLKALRDNDAGAYVQGADAVELANASAVMNGKVVRAWVYGTGQLM